MSKILALLTLASFHHSKDNIQPDFKIIHSQMNALTSGLLENLDKQDEYLKINKKDIEQLLAQTDAIKNNSKKRRGLRLRKKHSSFRHLKANIITYREILASAMTKQNNPISAG